MGFGTYRGVLARPSVRRVLLLSFLIRIPMWAGNVILTLHVVGTLHHSYAQAGVVVAAATVALSLSAPWRGRRLDRVGLRRTVTPSLVVLTACWSVAPFLGYWPLLGLASLAGLFVVPTFSIMRQALIAAVGDHERKAALSIDSVVIELSFMIGPAIGVVLATTWQTSWAMFTCELASVAGGALLWLANPRLRGDDSEDTAADAAGRRSWLTVRAALVLGMALAATVVLTGTDVSVVAAMRALHHQDSIGWVLALWGLGSAVGGGLYGAMRRSIPLPLLLAGLALATAPVVVAREPISAGLLLVVAGFFCAPTVTASVDALSRVVPERARGEAMGWHGAAMTGGSALGAPLAGVAIDVHGWQGGFLITAALGLVAALAAAVGGRQYAASAAVVVRPEVAGSIAAAPVAAEATVAGPTASPPGPYLADRR